MEDEVAPVEPYFQTFNAAFNNILGSSPKITLVHTNNSYPWAHEAGVYLPDRQEFYVSSNRIKQGGSQRIQVSKVDMKKRPYTVQEINPDIPMANGGVKYGSGVLWCAQGTSSRASGLVSMNPYPPYKTSVVISNFHGRPFSSPNDVVIGKDGGIWFTDPIYGYEQGFRPKPQLPSQVYRYDRVTKSIRAVADGFGRPNGLAFNADQSILYVTDTDEMHGDGLKDLTRVSTIYAFDVIHAGGQPFLANRRLFAFADTGIPDGIKVDSNGNVYSGCGDGVNVWSPGGVLLGKIIFPGGVANFNFCKPGQVLVMNEQKLWEVTLASSVKPARNMLSRVTQWFRSMWVTMGR